jgi:predicted adenine nucleotide alpha hydrolase (AANH) superfamily ATPase
MNSKPKLLLHICCAPDQTVAVERTAEEYQVIGFFSNSCIEPRGEYYKRLEDARKLADIQSIELIDDEYLPEAFLALAKGLEKEPEQGKRCWKCFEYRMRLTAEKAKNSGFDKFATTLTVSPHKDADFINQTGEALAWELDIEYLATNFKKQAGFQRSVELAKLYGLYRQNYCGCRFSLAEKKKRLEAQAIAKIDTTKSAPKEKLIDPNTIPPGAFFKPKDAVSRRFKKEFKK